MRHDLVSHEDNCPEVATAQAGDQHNLTFDMTEARSHEFNRRSTIRDFNTCRTYLAVNPMPHPLCFCMVQEEDISRGTAKDAGKRSSDLRALALCSGDPFQFLKSPLLGI